MLAELIPPVWVGHWLDRSSKGAAGLLKRLWMGHRPVWRSPAWQTAAVVVLSAMVLGQVSKAKAAEGGILASQFASIQGIQAAWLDLKKDTEAIKIKVDEVGKKVEEINTISKYENASDALQNGDLASLKAFIAKGALPPGTPR